MYGIWVEEEVTYGCAETPSAAVDAADIDTSASILASNSVDPGARIQGFDVCQCGLAVGGIAILPRLTSDGTAQCAVLVEVRRRHHPKRRKEFLPGSRNHRSCSSLTRCWLKRRCCNPSSQGDWLQVDQEHPGDVIRMADLWDRMEVIPQRFRIV